MTLEMIETFLTILKYRNITAAAQKLYTSQSTVSHRLQLLEDEVGVPLFIRRKGQRMVDITPGGEEFIPIAERWMSIFRDTNKIKDHPSRRTLSIGGVDLINTYTFVPLYRQHLEKHPQIRLNVWTYHSGEMYHLLENRTLDIGYVYSQRRYQDILAKPLYREKMYVICHKNSPYHMDMDPKELSAENEIYLKWSSDYEMWHDRYWSNGKSLITIGTGAQLSLYLDVPGRWTIAPFSVYQALKNRENIALYNLISTPPPLICYEITHRYPKPNTEACISEFQQEVSAFIEQSESICRFENWMLQE